MGIKFRKAAFISLFSILMIWPSSGQAPPHSPDIPVPVMEVYTNSVAKVYTKTTRGSGFFISPTTFVTAAHVMQEWNTGSIEIAGKRYKTSLLFSVTTEDIAFLHVHGGVFKPAKLSQFHNIGETIYLPSYPFGESKLLSVGRIAGTNFTFESETNVTRSHSLLVMEIGVAPGSSGGPVLNNRGEVVGMVSSRFDPYSYAVPASSIQVLVEELGG